MFLHSPYENTVATECEEFTFRKRNVSIWPPMTNKVATECKGFTFRKRDVSIWSPMANTVTFFILATILRSKFYNYKMQTSCHFY